MKKVIFAPLVILLSIAFMQFSPTKLTTLEKGPKWESLGSKAVDIKGEKDIITVSAKDGVFTAVKFHCAKAPIHLHKIKIVFGNGQSKEVIFNTKIAKGKYSKTVDLPGNKRTIKKIVFFYKTIPGNNGKAIVTAFGRH